MQNTFKEQAKTKLILSPFEPDVIVHRYLWTLPWAHRCPSSVFSTAVAFDGCIQPKEQQHVKQCFFWGGQVDEEKYTYMIWI